MILRKTKFSDLTALRTCSGAMRELKSLLSLLIVCLLGCGRIDGIDHEQPLASIDWCINQPCLEWGGLVISQPTSSLLVYVLALLSINVGWRFLRVSSRQKAQFWWGISLLLGGIGALAAGTSYQAFGFEIKCSGLEYCVWTSWWEIGYELLTVLSASALLLAVAHSCFSSKWVKISGILAVLNTLAYFIIVTYGLISLSRVMLSFEMMLLFTAPAYVAILILNVIQYLQTPSKLLKSYILSWAILFSTLAAYFMYMMAGYTQALWKNGIWFSDNDVLHVGMLLWVLFVWKEVMPSVTDKKNEIQKG